MKTFFRQSCIVPVLVIFLISTIFVQLGCSADSVHLQQKTVLVKRLVQKQKQVGRPISYEASLEINKARQAQQARDFVALEESLDNIIALLSQEDESKTGPSFAIELERGAVARGDELAQADRRIEKYRKATAQIRVVDHGGKPLPDTRVKIEQTHHEFLFGMNRNRPMLATIMAKRYSENFSRHWHQSTHISDELLDKYLEYFADFANYTLLPVNWNSYERYRGDIDYSLYDSEVQLLKEKGFAIRAGHLVWNSITPSWVPDDCQEMSAVVKKRIEDFIHHYGGEIDYYSVVNEAADPFDPLHVKDKMTKCYREIGKIQFVRHALKSARAVEPSAKLVINETSRATLAKTAFLQLLEGLKDDQGQPLYDVIGIQSHMHRKLWTLEQVWDILVLYGQFGVPIQFTEVSVLSGTPIAGKSFGRETTVEGEKKQADYVRDFYTLLFSHPAVESIQWWNLTDLGSYKKAPSGLLRKDMSPKPAYHVLKNLIKNTWWTRTDISTDSEGFCAFNGFYGTYRVIVTLDSGKSRNFEIKLSKQGQREFILEM